MKVHRLLLLVFVTASSGCYRIRYINNVPSEATPAADQWHHNLIEGLWEISKPVDVTQACPQGFAEVKNEVTFLNWFASQGVQAAVNAPIILATSSVDPNTGLVTAAYVPFTIWSPQTVSITCSSRTVAAEQKTDRR